MAVGKDSVERAARTAAGKGRKKTVKEKSEGVLQAAGLTEDETAAAQTEEKAGAVPGSGKKKGVIGIGDEMPIYYY